MDDQQLYAGLKGREPKALAGLIDKYGPTLYALCQRILAGAGSSRDVEECVSDAFYAAWQRIDEFNPARVPIRTWVLILAKYIALERRRRLGKEIKVLPLQEPPHTTSGELLAWEERERLQGALNTLSALDRELVYRLYFLEEKIEDLAKAFSLSRQAVDNRLWRARQSMRQVLKDKDVPE